MSSSTAAEDRALGQLFDRMIPTLKRAILRDSERRPEALSLEIVLLEHRPAEERTTAILTP